MIEFNGVTKEEILSDPTEYTAALSAEGCIAFRQIGLTRDEFAEVTQALGMDDSPVAQDIDHGTRFRQAVENPAILSGGLFLAWHMEDTYKEHLPQIIAINMHTFKVPHEPTEWPGGQTGFVDMHQCHNMMPSEWKESLKDARMLAEQVSYIPEPILQHPHPLFMEDPMSGEIVVHAQGHSSTTEPPYRLDPETCPDLSEGDIDAVNQWIQDFMYIPEYQQWYSWLEGDMVVFNGIRFAHAVSDGFEQGQRVFDRTAYHGGNDDAWKVPSFEGR